MGFSVWNDKNICLSWEETLIWFKLLQIESVPVLYYGIYDEKIIKSLWNPINYHTKEGYVIRIADEFSYNDFKNSVGKFVRENHVQTDRHWKLGQKIIPNELI